MSSRRRRRGDTSPRLMRAIPGYPRGYPPMTPGHRASAHRALRTLIAIGISLPACRSSARTGSSDAAVSLSAGEGGAGAGSCRVYEPGQHVLATCIDYVGSDYTAANAPSVCTTNVRSGPSEYSPSACPAAARVGSCVVNAGTTVTTILRSYPPASASARPTCTEAAGSWTPN
jgi:hypothetical protein